MICKECGIFNEDYLEFCKNCAAELGGESVGQSGAQTGDPSFDTPEWARTANRRAPSRAPVFDNMPPGSGAPAQDSVFSEEYAAEYPRRRQFSYGKTRNYVPPTRQNFRDDDDYEQPEGAHSTEQYTADVDEIAEAAPPAQSDSTRRRYATQNAPGERRPARTPQEQSFQGARPAYAPEGRPQREQAPIAAPPRRRPLYDNADQERFGRRYTAQDEAAPRSAYSTTGYASDFSDTKPTPRVRERMAHMGEPEPFGRLQKGRSHKRGKSKWFPLAIGGGIVLVLAIVCVLFVQIQHDGNFGSFFAGIFGSSASNKTVISPSTADGKPSFSITVHSKPGDTVRLTLPDADIVRDRVTNQNGQATFNVVASAWIPVEPTAATIEVTPQLALVDSAGNETPIEAESFTVEVPRLEMTLTKPMDLTFTAENSSIEIAGQVSQAGGKLLVADKEIPVDAQGNFSTEYQLEAQGSHTIPVVAKLSRHLSATAELNVTYDKREVAIEITTSPLRTSMQNEMLISGKAEPGSAITITGEKLLGEPTINTSSGEFSFRVNTDEVGLHNIEVTAELAGTTTTRVVGVERTPNVDEYTRKSQAIDDYAALASRADSKKGTNLKCAGTVSEIVQSEPYYILKLNVGSSSKEQLILIEYHGSLDFETGTSTEYRLYGDVVGKDEATELPKVYAWFAYKGLD